MTRRAFIHPRAELDIEEQADHLRHHADLATGARFQAAAWSDILELLATPLMGSPRRFRRSRLAGLRQWRVSGFEKVLIFYRQTDFGIEVLRVLHGARDVARILRRIDRGD
jgi:toxin ParE1/3/4